MLVPVILCGGSGTRLWPLSREQYPKQFLQLVGELSLFQQAVRRAQLLKSQALVIICNEAHRFLVREQLLAINVYDAYILLEPEGRNSAAAIFSASIFAEQLGATACVALPADHLIDPEKDWAQAILAAQTFCADKIITFGIMPRTATSAYGYIECGAAVAANVYQIQKFHEKPDTITAEKYLAAKNYYWNSGAFVFSTAHLRSLATQLQPDLYQQCLQAVQAIEKDIGFYRLPAEFSDCGSIAFDHAIMEQTQAALVMPLDLQWSDLGSWHSVYAVSPKDAAGNYAQGNVQLHDCSNSMVISKRGLVAVHGLDNILVIATDDVVLVADLNNSESIKSFVSHLRALGCAEIVSGSRSYRPWGHYATVLMGERFQVKLIVVNPGASLSLQKHFHRSEHWIVVRGTARVNCNEREFMVTENESTYIPVGIQHRLANPGKIPLELIEIQSGAYLGEDDIVRYDDHYGRVQAMEPML